MNYIINQISPIGEEIYLLSGTIDSKDRKDLIRFNNPKNKNGEDKIILEGAKESITLCI